MDINNYKWYIQSISHDISHDISHVSPRIVWSSAIDVGYRFKASTAAGDFHGDGASIWGWNHPNINHIPVFESVKNPLVYPSESHENHI